MSENKNIPELLSPAGNAQSAYAAVENGCDAVYLGGRDFSARNLADNFTDGQLEEIIDYCHLRGVKVYITVNTIYTNSELARVFEFMAKMYRYGADAFILQDIGVAMRAKKLFPDIALHASTQMTANSLSDVLYLESVGFDRIVLSRELSLDEIKHISKNCKIGLEVFVHGALCVSFSGQCLMSSFIGKRSGNRGKCAQSCRQKYSLLNGGTVVDSGYLLSPKDLMTLEILGEILETGVASMKIEGRMKSPEYVAQVTKAYREQLDRLSGGDSEADPATIKKVTQVFNRGGFTQGYYKNYSAPAMISKESPKSIGTYLGKVMSYDAKRGICKIFTEDSLAAGDGIEIWTKKEPHAGTNINKQSDKAEVISVSVTGGISSGDKVYKSYDKTLMDESAKLYEKDTRKTIIKGEVKAVINEPVTLTLSYNGIVVKKTGAIVEQSQKAPMTEQKILDQLSKTGGTPFVIDFENCKIGENIFVGLSALNELRREAVSELTEKLVLSRKRKTVGDAAYDVPPVVPNKTEKKLTALVRNNGQFNGVVNSGVIKRIYFDVTNAFITNLEKYVAKCEENGIELFAALPHTGNFDEYITALEKSGIAGYLVKSGGAVLALDGTEKQIALDHSFNVINKMSFDFLKHGADTVCLSPEISMNAVNETADRRAEVIIYGKIPLMLTRQCPVGLFAAGKGGGKYCKLKNNSSNYYLKDKMGVKFPIVTNCEQCTAYIFNDRPLFMLNRMAQLKSSACGFLRLSFTDETMGQAYDICAAYADSYSGMETDKTQSLTAKMEDEGFTYGYFFSEFE